MKDSTRGMKLTTDRHEASHGLSATAELLVCYQYCLQCNSLLVGHTVHESIWAVKNLPIAY